MSYPAHLTRDEEIAFDALAESLDQAFEFNEEHLLDDSVLLKIYDS